MAGMDSRNTRVAGAQPSTVKDFIEAVVISPETRTRLVEIANNYEKSVERIVGEFRAQRGIIASMQSRSAANGGPVEPVSDDKILQDIKKGLEQGSIGPRS